MIQIDTGAAVMFFSSERTSHEAEGFKLILQDLQHEHRLTQEDLAQEFGVSQSTVCQWLRLRNDNHFPAFLLAKLPEPMRTLAIRWILRDTDVAVERKLPVREMLTGDLTECVLAMDTVEAEIIREMKTDPRKCRTQVERLRAICQRLEAEIDYAERSRA